MAKVKNNSFMNKTITKIGLLIAALFCGGVGAYFVANSSAAIVASCTPNSGFTPYYRLVYPPTGVYLYTASSAERDIAVSKYKYRYEGIVACVVPVTHTTQTD